MSRHVTPHRKNSSLLVIFTGSINSKAGFLYEIMERFASVIGQQQKGLTVGVSLLIIVLIVVLAAVVYTPSGATARCLRRNRTEEHLSLTDNRIS
ncbi:hypothetical protein E1301_Tti007903 [Triplophysa tibetana]|uniref:Uncharacterized protein n=1 Tax=Triplophysa tibetana TaxID=1572043 RepID=A0A5A9MYV5_9TELE|nr:hypothetical protein E1301_Tti007903 [Triplophysa tibetana]